MVAYPLHPLTAACAGKDVETHLRPVRNSLRDLDGFVLGVVGGIEPVRRVFRSRQRLRAIRGEITVQLQHRRLRRNRVRSIDLNFVIILCNCRLEAYAKKQRQQQQ